MMPRKRPVGLREVEEGRKGRKLGWGRREVPVIWYLDLASSREAKVPGHRTKEGEEGFPRFAVRSGV